MFRFVRGGVVNATPLDDQIGMPQSPSSKAIDSTIAAGPRELLRSCGFRKMSRLFSRQTNDIYHVVDFQASQFNDPDDASFTVNVGVTHPGLHETYCGRPFPTNPGTAVHAISIRLGRLIPSQQTDLWWDVSPDTDVTALGESIASLLRAHALPFLDTFGSVTDVLDALSTNPERFGVGKESQVFEAILHSVTGSADEAEAVFAELLAGKSSEGFKNTVQIIRQELLSSG